ncbi:hypothetical protein CERSUDRAFT_96983 [Gelatoporia subvermispora B]|uniref:Uncharacterized protein n=1 Tax=Ceriporiopsis subvermispora (strain B) TaxID=914234 RepID=M2QDF1_CERS8|nr:hypothetical protein CERSUDRAFT_96983 [Gelatoporia subvermispora B]
MQHDDGLAKPPPAKKPRLAPGDGFAKTGKPSMVQLSTPKFVSAFGPSTSRFAQPVGAPSRPTNRSGSSEPHAQDLNLPGPSRLPVPQKDPVYRELKPPPRPEIPGAGLVKNKRSHKKRSFVNLRAPILSGHAAPINVAEFPRFHDPNLSCAQKAVRLHDFVPPPPPGRLKPPGELRSILDTPVARATDPRTEHGSAALLSIFLKQHGTDYVEPTERELQRGLKQSPEKSKNKQVKYRRGGLAEDVKRLFAQKDTTLSLWQTETEGNLRRSHRPAPNLRVRIAAILHDVEDASNKTAQAPRTGIVRCRTSAGKAQDYIVFLSFGHFGSSPRLNKIEDLKDGRELYIWKPWQTMELPEDFAVDAPPSPSPEMPVISQRFPTFGTPEVAQGCAMLFCSRFWIAVET